MGYIPLNFMKRKIVKQGAATLMVSLPSKWTKRINLQKGDEVEITEKDNSLLISPGSQSFKKESKVQITSETESSIRTIITNAYRMGYESLLVYFDSEKEFDHIRNSVKNLIGFEIVTKERNKCVIENITEPSDEKFDAIFKKVLLNTTETFNILRSIFKKEKVFEDFNEVTLRTKKYDNFCRRLLLKSNPDDIILRWGFHSYIVHAQRELHHLINYLSKSKISIDKEELKLLDEAEKLFDMLSQAYNKKDLKLLEEIHSLEKDLVYKKGYTLLNDKTKDGVIAHYLVSAVRYFYLASSPLIGSNISSGIEE